LEYNYFSGIQRFIIELEKDAVASDPTKEATKDLVKGEV
jgi:hypothetical protein